MTAENIIISLLVFIALMLVKFWRKYTQTPEQRERERILRMFRPDVPE